MSLTEHDARLLEGSWEEILERTEELKGRRVQLLVLPIVEENKHKNNGAAFSNGAAVDGAKEIKESLMETFGRIGTVSFGPDDVSERSEELWQQGVEKKHGRATS